MGKRYTQHNSINWSYLKRGNVARNQTNIKQNKQVLKPKIIDCILIIVLLTKISGRLYPPKNKIADKLENNTIELYSAKKKNTNIIEECSVKKPATNSDSKKE